MDAVVSLITALGRLLLALLFIRGGLDKLGGTTNTIANMQSHGIPYPNVLVWGAVLLELGGGLMLVLGLYARCVALAFFFYTLTLAIIFHPYWTFADAAASRAQTAVFFGHLAIMGGMLFVVAFGAGAFSVDALIGRSKPRS
jgi:putative oxidoreductase